VRSIELAPQYRGLRKKTSPYGAHHSWSLGPEAVGGAVEKSRVERWNPLVIEHQRVKV
jgi:hypothetical protein